MTIAVTETLKMCSTNNYKSKENLFKLEDLRFDTAIFYVLNWFFEHQANLSIKNWKICILADNIREHEIFLFAQILQFLSNTALYFEYNEYENTWVLDLQYIKDNFKEIFQIFPEC